MTRGGREVVHDVDFAVAAGTVCGLLGPSGCGKSTVLRSLVGVQAGVRGLVTVLGESAGTLALRSRVGYVTQTPALYADLTVAENLTYFAEVLGLPPGSVSGVVTDVVLDDCAGQLVGTLSGGQRARASLASALLGYPELLVLDEPTVGLDPVLRRDLWVLFHRLAAAGTTLLVSSHVMDEAARCDRLLLMRDGRLVADDTPAGLMQRSGTRDVEEAFLQLATADRVAP